MVKLILLILAVICFLLAAFWQSSIGVVGLIPLGLTFFTASFITPYAPRVP